MITAGIDVGVQYVKAVILQDGIVAGKAMTTSGMADRAESINFAYNEALKSAGVTADAVEKIVVTGKGKFQAGFAGKQMSEQVAAARAARYFNPGATCALSIGADETMISVLGEGNRIDEYAFNQKCTAGIGLFLEYTADRLGISLDQMGSLPETEAAINEGCVVMADLGILELLNKGATLQTAASAAVNAAAVRVNSVINDITKPNTNCVVLMGGVARNGALVRTLTSISGIEFYVPDNAEYAGAIGAALS